MYDKRSLPVVIFAYTTGYIGYYLTNILFMLLSLPFVPLLAPFPRLRHRIFLRVIHWYAYVLTQIFLPLLGVCHVDEVSGLDRGKKLTPRLYVSNHRGRLDALLLIGILKNTVVLIKSKHAKFPMLAHLVQHCGFVSVDKSSAISISEALKKCCTVLKSGTNLLFFPEGTRSTGTRLQTFGSMAFKVAIEQDTPIVPVIIYSQNPFMAKKLSSFYPRKRIGYHIHFLDPVSPEENDSPADLSDRVRRLMTAELKKQINLNSKL
ncbi:1-acyl-sn-glycerol-3-phosphate acyltransferase [PVC group bacterium]|nr:1-acyl-sn-glycerol-3-phosphate acyltransferase [PVC group bacterium]